MILTSIRIRDEQWQEWVRGVGNTRTVRRVELPAQLLVSDGEVKAELDRYALRPCHAHSLIPDEISPYLFEISDTLRQEACQQAVKTIQQLAAWHVQSVSLDLGLERIKPADLESGLQQRLEFMNELLVVARDENLKLCLAVRLPRPFEGSRSWELAGNLMHDSCSPQDCRLAMDLVPADMPADFDINRFVRTYCLHVEVIRFHYAPTWGGDLESTREREWLDILKWYGYRGEFVFCPQVTDSQALTQVCQDIDQHS